MRRRSRRSNSTAPATANTSAAPTANPMAGNVEAKLAAMRSRVTPADTSPTIMSEARAVTNFSGNAVATVLVGAWTKTVDYQKLNDVLDGKDPFDELTMVDDHGSAPAAADTVILDKDCKPVGV